MRCADFVTRLLLATVAFPTFAPAVAADADFSRLGKDLTPIGAERAGNADGTIPAWEGGLTTPPPGWNPKQGYVDPFPDDKPLFTITAANAAQYADKLRSCIPRGGPPRCRRK
jgi:hypothetical protein